MTPKDEERIRELPRLIADEKDNEKVIELASELEQLLMQRSKEEKDHLSVRMPAREPTNEHTDRAKRSVSSEDHGKN